MRSRSSFWYFIHVVTFTSALNLNSVFRFPLNVLTSAKRSRVTPFKNKISGPAFNQLAQDVSQQPQNVTSSSFEHTVIYVKPNACSEARLHVGACV